jgi:hypothetical protein
MSKRIKNPVCSWNFDLPSPDTMTIPCFKNKFLNSIPLSVYKFPRVADLFARNCQLGTPGLRNDIDPATKADEHLDVFEFLKIIPEGSLDAVIIDPPFSFNQAAKHYKNSAGKCLGVGWIPAVRREAGKKLKHGGLMFCLGWDANGAGNRKEFVLEEVIICAHGQARNATIMTIDRKI